jgi:hypothetical protein
MKPMWLALAILAGLGAAVDAHAVGRLVDVNVIDRDSHMQLPIIRYHGRYYVAGEPGHHYRIELQSQLDRRILSVVSVDGVNAISGDTAHWSQPGYVLDAYRRFSVLGWRKSEQQVAGFLFTDLGQSYAALTGRPDNVGVIGVAVFRERPPVEQETTYFEAPEPQIAIKDRRQPPVVASQPMPTQAMPAEAIRAQVMPAPAAPVAPVQEAGAVVPQARMAAPKRRSAQADTFGPLGTGHGEREDSVVHTVDFERASATPDEIVTIYYDTRARLMAQGILPAVPVHTPQAFPGHYAPDP